MEKSECIKKICEIARQVYCQSAAYYAADEEKFKRFVSLYKMVAAVEKDFRQHGKLTQEQYGEDYE